MHHHFQRDGPSCFDAAGLDVLKRCRTSINISVDSFNEETEAYLRGIPGALPNALKSIIKLKEYRIPLTLLTVISVCNFRELSAPLWQGLMKSELNRCFSNP